MDEFLDRVKKEDFYIEPQQSVFDGVFNVYEKVVIESLLTAFALDFLKSEVGGTIDTIHNVRNGIFKDQNYKKLYDARGDYTKDIQRKYHGGDENYRKINAEYSVLKKEGKLIDAYTGKVVLRNADIDLDHVVPTEEIHNDAGRILSGLSVEELANNKTNLKPTDRSINRSMSNSSKEEYLNKLENQTYDRKQRIDELKGISNLSDKERKELHKLKAKDSIDAGEVRRIEKESRNYYEFQIAKNYYLSSDFLLKTAKDAGKIGLSMGVTQVTGFVFAEIWVVTKEEIMNLPVGCDFAVVLKTIGNGIDKGFKSALSKYKELIEKFGEGFLAGTLSSLVTVLINMFYTTSEFLVKNIRQIMASITRSAGVLLINPDDLELGDRLKASMIIMATGASTLAGSYVGVKLTEVMGTVPIIGTVVPRFCTALISGLLSCTFLLFMDRSAFINQLVTLMNKIPTEVTDLKRINEYFEEYSAKLNNIDLEQFKKDIEEYDNVVNLIEKADSESELNDILKGFYNHFNLPWTGDFDEFMSDSNNQLVFE